MFPMVWQVHLVFLMRYGCILFRYRISMEAEAVRVGSTEEISIQPHPASIDSHHRGAIARESAPSPPKPRKAAGYSELEL